MWRPIQMMDYCFRASDMVLAAHSYTVLNNESKGTSISGAHIFLSENLPIPPMNSAVLIIAKIINSVMASAAEYELLALYITTK